MSQQLLTEQEFAAWLLEPVTKMFRDALNARRAEILESWAAGAFTAESEFGTKFLNGQALGAARTLKEVLDLDHEAINGAKSD